MPLSASWSSMLLNLTLTLSLTWILDRSQRAAVGGGVRHCGHCSARACSWSVGRECPFEM